jgi:hypothetical protein
MWQFISRYRFGTVPFGVVLCVGIAASIPRPMSAKEAQSASGGCGSGKCYMGMGYNCGEPGDGCGYYEECIGTSGDLLCTPQKYCTTAGCSPVDGAICK